MTCYHPMTGYRSNHLTANGKRKLVFNPSNGYSDLPVTISCGQCIGCRLKRSRNWAIRCVHEAQLHKQNSFITLTYNDENYPQNGSLDKSHFQKFMKRLRKAIFPNKLRYFHCGEYGAQLKRPHYHAILFGMDWIDKYETQLGGRKIYRSTYLEKLWPFGFSTVGDVTFESAAYVARYITKKHFGQGAEDHYERINEFGEIVSLQPEYVTMSRRPGIAKEWFVKYSSDVFPQDHVVLKGKTLKPPKYYDNLYEIYDPLDHKKIKMLRKKLAIEKSLSDTIPLQDKEFIQNSKMRLLTRSYENDL